MVTDYERQKMNEIFNWFEENKFENTGLNSRDMNLVFEFSDWIDSQDGFDFICNEFEYIEDDELEKAKDIQAKFSAGINAFIKQERRANYPFLF